MNKQPPKSPKVSVILTSYNHAKYIREAIDSVLDQTFRDFELIIWDDASSDDSWDIINSYSDPRISTYRNDESRRAIYGLNKAISEVAKGEYIAIHHSDDVWEPEKLEKQVALLDARPDIGAVFTWVQIIDEHGTNQQNEWFTQQQKTRWQWLRELFVGENHLNHPSALVRKVCYETVGLYRFGLAQTGDAEFWSRLLFQFEINVIEERLTRHRFFSDGSNTSGTKNSGPLRTENEWVIIRSNFLELATREDLFRIFPTLEKYNNPSGWLPEFLVAMACLRECSSRAAWALGLSSLYKLIITPSSAARIKELYNFDYRDLVKLSGEFDVFGVEALSERDAQLADRDAQLANLRDIVAWKDHDIRNLQQQLTQIVHSRSWRLTAPLRKGIAAIRQGVRIFESLKNRARQQLVWAVLLCRSILRTVFLYQGSWRLAARRVSGVLRREGVGGVVRHVRVLMGKARIDSHKMLSSSVVIDAEVEAIEKSGLFDESYYLSMYADLQIPRSDAIRHYCERGWREGRNPSDDFDTRSYLATYSDIRNAGINPFWHYVVAGASELRHAMPDLAIRYEDDIRFGVVDTDIKLLAFYSSPDWALLRGRRPASKGSSQPLLPHEELGLYDPWDWRVLEKQARIAKRHGLYGFCLHTSIPTDGAASPQPLDLFLAHEDIDFRFCLRADLGPEGMPEPLAASILRAVSDKRYIHIEGRPVIVVTMPGERQYATHAVSQLKRWFVDHGVSSLFLIGRWAQAGEEGSGVTLADLCDATLDLPGAPLPSETGNFLPLDKNGVNAVSYGVVTSRGVGRVQDHVARPPLSPVYHVVILGRDNTAQEPEHPLVYTRFHIRDYRRWLDAAMSSAKLTHPEDRRFVFVNAWNDWNEGLFLEPDRQGGFGRVNETARALLNIPSGLAMPKVSVIVPNYNHEPYLRRRLDSIYGQTYKNIEVLLLDDCSSDQSRSVMDQYAADYPEITRTLYNDKNSGGAFRQWAKGIKAATGDLVWIAESDDFCDERFLEVLVRCFDDEAVLLAYAKTVFVDKNEIPMRDEFNIYVNDLECAEKWNESYVETAHNEVGMALGVKNTIPNASGALFKRPIDMPLLDDESWLSMVVAGDWVFYLHIIRGGKIAYSTEATNFFRRYEGSAAETTYKKDIFYRELGMASRTVQALYAVPLTVLEQCQRSCKAFYDYHLGISDEQFSLWYDYESIIRARENRLPNVMVSTMGFYPGGAEILPIRMANEFKRQGLSVLLLSAGLNPHENGVRRMLRNDVPLIETSDVEAVKTIIHDFGVEVLNTHQWHIQKYPLQVPDVFNELTAHVASLHGMIEHGDAFGVTEEQLRKADQNVTTWVYTAEKNLVPFSNFGLYDKSSARFVKIPNGMQPPNIVPIPRSHMNIPEDAFALCCVSRAIPDKGWEETILAVESARTLSGRDIRLILVGNGPVYDEYCRSGVPDFVYLAGFSENSVGYYAAADMGIMLTKFKSESFPLTIVDCLFAGKPYIASDVGDIRNMLTTDAAVAGEVIELEDWEVPIERTAQVIAAFATDKQKYLNAMASVQDVANRYRIDVVAQQYVHLFESGRDARWLR